MKSFNSLAVNLDAPATGMSGWTDKEIRQLLANFHLDPDTPLSVLAVEMMPRYDQYLAFVQEERHGRAAAVPRPRTVPDPQDVAAGRGTGSLLRELLTAR